MLSRVRLFVTQWTTAHQVSLSITNSQSLPKLMSTELVMPSSHLILCHPLLLLPSIFPSIRYVTKGGTKQFQQNELETTNDSSYYADMLIKTYLYMEVDIQSGSCQEGIQKKGVWDVFNCATSGLLLLKLTDQVGVINKPPRHMFALLHLVPTMDVSIHWGNLDWEWWRLILWSLQTFLGLNFSRQHEIRFTLEAESTL